MLARTRLAPLFKKAARRAAREHGQGTPHVKGAIHKQKRDQHAVSAAKPLTGTGKTVSAGPNSSGNGKANPTSRTSSTTRAHLTETSFASLPISPLTSIEPPNQRTTATAE